MVSERLGLRDQLLNWLLMPLLLVLIFAGAVSYLAAIRFANLPYDQALLETARILAGHFRQNPSGPALDLPPSAKRMLLGDSQDRIYFKVSRADGSFLAGEPQLPAPVNFSGATQVQFADADFRGVHVRVANLREPLDDQNPGQAMLVQVAETIHKRERLTHEILQTMIVPQLLLIVLAGGAVWLGLRRGLKPLGRLQDTLAARAPHDLSPVELKPDIPEEITPLLAAFNGILERMRRVVESQKRFVADAAHQLRTPFAGLKTQAELALRQDDMVSVRRALNHILTSAERGNELVSQLLVLARHDPEANETLQLKSVDLNSVVQEAALAHVDEALAKRIDLGFEPHYSVMEVIGDAVGLKELAGNLIDNAVHYTPEGGKVTARVQQDAGNPIIVVEDNGPGIPPAERERVFERFYRVMGSNQPGSGLGLAIVKGIARLHRAAIEIGAPPTDSGTVVTVRFPSSHGPEIGPQDYPPGV